MSKAVKYAERAVTIAAQGAWTVFEKLNSIKPERRRSRPSGRISRC